MNRWIPFVILLFPVLLYAQSKTEVERINFFPSSDAFAIFAYQYQSLKISTPQSTVLTKEVNNFTNLFSLTFAHKITPSTFLGLKGEFEEASENAVRFGLPLRRRFNSYGFKEPEIFILHRFRDQKNETGVIDVFLGLTPSAGEREIGDDNSNRLNGRNIVHAALSHGLWEEEWEFRSSLDYFYFGSSMEENDFTDENIQYALDSYYNLFLQFKTQYRMYPVLFIFGSIGADFRSSQNVGEFEGEKLQIQTGTGSVFSLGLKRLIGDWHSLEFSYLINRNDYFVKGVTRGMDGDAKQEIFSVNLTMGL
jgi:hypothetical protein